jgi:hypothetical protein
VRGVHVVVRRPERQVVFVDRGDDQTARGDGVDEGAERVLAVGGG